MAQAKKLYVVDGRACGTLATTAEEFSRAIGWTMAWNGNLNAFNDLLHGGFGTPDEGFILRWQYSKMAEELLGYDATVLWLEKCVNECHPSSVSDLQTRLAAARRNEGETLFDILVAIIRTHEDIELQLK